MLTTPLLCLLGFAMWAIALVSAIGAMRVPLVVTKKKKAGDFPAGQQHGGDAYWRLNRAHLNTLENLPIFGAIVVVGSLAGTSDPLFATLAQVVLGARIVQSLIHISSGRTHAINLRFTAYLTQVTCMAWMALLVLRSGS